MIQVLYLGRVDYAEALRIQAEVESWRYAGRVHNVLLLLEHPPVLTLGRNADRSNVLASDELLSSRGITLHPINRGGDVTYHGPGQLVGYPIFDLRSLRTAKGNRMGPVDFVRSIEEALIRVCGTYGVRAGRIPGLTGVWCPGPADGRRPSGRLTSDILQSPADGRRAARQSVPDDAVTASSMNVSSEDQKNIPPEEHPGKIAAIGIHVSRGITSHGFAFNVSTRLEDFRLINPCGITDKPVTSLEVLRSAANSRGPSEPMPSLEEVANEAAR